MHDLGQAWREWTGLPMVFAVWAVRRDFADAHPGLVKEVHEAFLRSPRPVPGRVGRGRRGGGPLGAFDAATLATYFRTLDFSLGERQVAGLREFARAGADRPARPRRPAATDGPEFFAGAFRASRASAPRSTGEPRSRDASVTARGDRAGVTAEWVGQAVAGWSRASVIFWQFFMP